ncbi:MAG: hypothetical protein KDI36_16915 [Pseudomonadales bacterium]|nr:hypothetical protein [Pseudomonadales bacterium]
MFIDLVQQVLFITAWFLPMVLIARSRRIRGSDKVLWLMAALFTSWLAWVFLQFKPFPASGDDDKPEN